MVARLDLGSSAELRESSSLSEGTMKKIIIEYNDLLIKVSCSKDSTSIQDSYRIKDYINMRDILIKIRMQVNDEELAINKRSLKSMIKEWRVHNLLYSFGIERDRTCTVDIEAKQSWYVKLLYTIISPFYFHFY